MVDELPGDAEFLLDVGGEGFDAEGLGGVVAAVDEIDADFLGEGVAPVRAFAGDEGVDAGLGDGGDFGACAAGHDADFPAGGGTAGAEVDAGAGGGGETLHELIAADFGFDLGAVFGALGLHEIAGGFEAEGAGEDGVVAEGGMEIEREVGAVNGESGIERDLDFLEDGAGPGLEAGPEHAVVHDEQIGTCGDGFFDDGQGGIHGGDDLGDFTFAVFELEAVEGVGVVRDLGDAQFGVEVGDEVGEIHAGQWISRLDSMCIMCCFTGKVEEVKNTRIFGRLGERGNQVLIYQMSVNVPRDLAMVLPIPIKKGTGEDAVKFFDFSKYDRVFEDMWEMFPMPSYRADPFGAAPAAATSRSLEVVSVGAYDASFVPTAADFSRLDERFRMPERVWAKLPGYEDFGFAVFKLKPGNARVHPMAFAFPTALAGTVFFPTLHIHDGNIHAKETFDHTLYLQGEGLNVMGAGWEESPGLAVTKVKCGYTHGMVRPEMHVYRNQIRGISDNGDILVKPKKV